MAFNPQGLVVAQTDVTRIRLWTVFAVRRFLWVHFALSLSLHRPTNTPEDSNMRTLKVFALALFMPLAANSEVATAPTGALEIKITNIEHGSGTLYLAVLNSADGWLKSDASSRPFREATQAVTGTSDVLVSIGDLPPGKYAISLFQDLNGDSKLDTNMVGFPKEPFGFSASMGSFGPPGFDDAAIEFSGNNASVEIKLN
jgi:uncharacterized protein (DUF2141 family)